MAINPNASEGTFSRRPFITFDGADNQGVRAEVKVVVGYGDITEIEPTKAGKSNNVTFIVHNTKWAISGYSRDERIIKLVTEAQEKNLPVFFRIETRRKPGIDRSRPFDTLVLERGEEVVKSLAAVKLNEEDEWTMSRDAVTNPKEDPKGELHSALDQEPAAPEEKPRSSRNNEFEPPPYVGRWHGKVNPGTIAVNVPISFYVEIFNYEKAQEFTLSEERRREVALVLLKIANRLQKDAIVKIIKKEYKGPDLTAGSHTRARALIFEAMRSFYPVTQETLEDREKFAQWQKDIYSISLELWKWGIESVDEFID